MIPTTARWTPRATVPPEGGRKAPPILARVTRRIRFRPPGLKPTTKIGTLGPYRGRLGLGWVIAPMVVGVLLLLLVGGFLLFGR